MSNVISDLQVEAMGNDIINLLAKVNHHKATVYAIISKHKESQVEETNTACACAQSVYLDSMSISLGIMLSNELPNLDLGAEGIES